MQKLLFVTGLCVTAKLFFVMYWKGPFYKSNNFIFVPLGRIHPCQFAITLLKSSSTECHLLFFTLPLHLFPLKHSSACQPVNRYEWCQIDASLYTMFYSEYLSFPSIPIGICSDRNKRILTVIMVIIILENVQICLNFLSTRNMGADGPATQATQVIGSHGIDVFLSNSRLLSPEGLIILRFSYQTTETNFTENFIFHTWR